MRYSFLIILSALALLLLPFDAPAQGRERDAAQPDEDFVLERTVNAEPGVVVSICVAHGNVVVRGWERSEVRARSGESGGLRLESAGAQPARRVEVIVSEERDGRLEAGACGSSGSLEVSVPRGATVNLRVRDGHVEISDVAEARVEALSGDVDVRRVSRSVEVTCMSGDVSLEDSSGRVRLRTVSGSVEARNLETSSARDEFEADSTSGDVRLEGVKHSQVRGATISGSILYTGRLASGGVYDFKTISGDVTVALPADSSFNLRAKVVVDGEIITDFPVKTAGLAPNASMPPTPPPAPGPPGPPRRGRDPHNMGQTRLDGTVGSGDALLNLTSLNGTLHLKRQ